MKTLILSACMAVGTACAMSAIADTPNADTTTAGRRLNCGTAPQSMIFTIFDRTSEIQRMLIGRTTNWCGGPGSGRAMPSCRAAGGPRRWAAASASGLTWRAEWRVADQ